MGIYKFSTESESSEFDDENGKKYRYKKLLGEGAYDQANEFSSTDGLSSIAVLKPVRSVVKISLERKKDFFQKIYGISTTSVYYQDEDYRLIIPYIPGQTYSALIESGAYSTPEARSPLKIIPLFLSAIAALKGAHEKEIIVMDLKSDNILYDDITKTSYLVDGGISWQKNTKFKLLNSIPSKQRVHCPHIAPECFRTVLVTPAIDIYSLGYLMLESLFKMQWKDSELIALCHACLSRKPADRPSLADVEEKLMARLNVEEVYSYLCKQDLNIDLLQVYSKIANNPQLISYILELQKIDIRNEAEKNLLNTVLKSILLEPLKKRNISEILKKVANKRELKTLISTLQKIFGLSLSGVAVLGFLKHHSTEVKEHQEAQLSPADLKKDVMDLIL